MECKRSAYDWLECLQTAKVDVQSNTKLKRTVGDVVERLNGIEAAGKYTEDCIPTSPRSIEACLRLGIDPIDLVHKPLVVFQQHDADTDIAQFRYEQSEQLRKDLIQQLVSERQKLLDGSHTAHQGNTITRKEHDESKTNLVEKERQRLEVLKRRQEKELNQIVNHEKQRQMMIAKQQLKLEAVERRAAEMRKKKSEKDALWKQQQHQRDQNRMKEAERLEAAAKEAARLRFLKEQERQKSEKQEEKRRMQLAIEHEREHREKAEKARIEAQKALEENQTAAVQRRVEMEKRDAARQKKINEEKETKAIANQEKRRMAQERREAALDKDREIQIHKQAAFQRREQESEARRKALEFKRKEDEQKRKEEQKQKEEYRKEKYEQAMQNEELRILAIRKKAEDKNKVLELLKDKQAKRNAYTAAEREMKSNMKREKAERMKKIQTYQRQMLFERIMEDRLKIGKQLEEKEELQRQRRLANMEASIQRERLNIVMEDMKKKQINNFV
eukprot:g616.t1